MISEIYVLILFCGNWLDIIQIVVLVGHQIFILFDVVHHMPQAHFRFLSHLWNFIGGQTFMIMEFFLNCIEDSESVFAGVVLHVFEEHAVDGEGGQFLQLRHFEKL